MEKRNEIEVKGAIEPVSLENTKTILKQMESCVCKIHLGPKKGTGFFIKIPFQDEPITVLITNNHVLNGERISIGRKITLSLNNDNKILIIEINDKRKIYTDETLDITIIEIKEKDNINNFLDLDKQILEVINSGNCKNIVYFNDLYENQSVYILNYVENVFVSFGLLTCICEDKITHKCSTHYGSSGSPILLLKTCSVIGIHIGGSKQSNDNYGILLIKSLIEFKNMTKNLLIKTKKKYN